MYKNISFNIKNKKMQRTFWENVGSLKMIKNVSDVKST